MNVIANKKLDWQTMEQVPVAVELPEEFQFRCFCPVSKEQSSEDNPPPMMMSCGHVLCRQTITRMSKNGAKKSPMRSQNQASLVDRNNATAATITEAAATVQSMFGDSGNSEEVGSATFDTVKMLQGQRSLALDTPIGVWQLLFAVRAWPLVNHWCDYLHANKTFASLSSWHGRHMSTAPRICKGKIRNKIHLCH
ncbi:Rmd5 protein [Raphanus sativus]|nr:Rmd5 protein [Raphanus sativus]